ncbi:hypothetical protein, partial [Escherichia coli]
MQETPAIADIPAYVYRDAVNLADFAWARQLNGE